MASPSPIHRRIGGMFAALLGLGATSAQSAQSAPISPDQAPPSWVAYAEGATRTITGWLNADTAPAPRVRAALDVARPTPDQPAPPLVVKIWMDKAGLITRVEFPPLADADADQDLRGLLLGHPLGPPPRRMRLPMRLALQLKPPPAATS